MIETDFFRLGVVAFSLSWTNEGLECVLASRNPLVSGITWVSLCRMFSLGAAWLGTWWRKKSKKVLNNAFCMFCGVEAVPGRHGRGGSVDLNALFSDLNGGTRSVCCWCCCCGCRCCRGAFLSSSFSADFRSFFFVDCSAKISRSSVDVCNLRINWSRPFGPTQVKAGFLLSSEVFLISPKAENTFAISYSLLI